MHAGAFGLPIIEHCNLWLPVAFEQKIKETLFCLFATTCCFNIFIRQNVGVVGNHSKEDSSFNYVINSFSIICFDFNIQLVQLFEQSWFFFVHFTTFTVKVNFWCSFLSRNLESHIHDALKSFKERLFAISLALAIMIEGEIGKFAFLITEIQS